MPRYFPESWKSLDRDDLIITLAISAAAAYLIYLVADRISIALVNSGSEKVIANSKKSTLFENQLEVVVQAYRRYTNILSCIAFISMAILGLYLIYPAINTALFGYLFFCGVMFASILALKNQSINLIQEHLADIASILSAIGFLLMFGFMVSDFMNPPEPGVIQSIIGLLLVRQLLNRVVTLLVDSKNLLEQRKAVNALFFHGHRLERNLSNKSKKLWSLILAPEKNWMHEIASNYSLQKPDVINLQHIQTGVDGALAFVINDITSKESLLFKFYGSHRHALGKREVEILSSCVNKKKNSLPALELLGEHMVDDVLCHVFRWHGSASYPPKELKVKRIDCLSALMSVTPSEAVVKKYNRSHQSLSIRMDDEMDQHLSALVSVKDRPNFEKYLKIKHELIKILDDLPLQYVNPNIYHDTLLQNDKNDDFLLNWSRWFIEPLGSNWPIHPKLITKIHSSLSKAESKRDDLQTINLNHVKLAAYLYQFDSYYSRNKFQSAIELLDEILTLYFMADYSVVSSELKLVNE